MLPDYVQMIMATCLHEVRETGVMVKTGVVFAYFSPLLSKYQKFALVEYRGVRNSYPQTPAFPLYNIQATY